METAEIDRLITSFFSAFNNKGSSEPALDAIHGYCIPEAIIIRKSGSDQEIFTLDTFIAPRKTILTDGTLTDFSEWEVKSETVVNRNIAQRRSEYEKTGTLNGNAFSERGTKMFHLIKTQAGWKIASVLWEDE